MAEIKYIPIEKIRTDQHSLRISLDDDSIDALAASIRRVGVLVPLIVSNDGDIYHVIAGHRRFAAALKVGLADLPCCVREDQKAVTSEISLAENIFRADLTAVEQASAIKDILEKGIMDVTTLATVMHRSSHWVSAQLDILTWPKDVLEAIQYGWLSVSAASNIALINDENYRDFLLRNAIESGASARTTAAWLQAWRAQIPPAEAIKQPPIDNNQSATPALPQCPCVVCGQMFRTDGLAMVLVCSSCLLTVRSAAS